MIRPRRGALLPMVLVAMVIIALAACAALFTVRQERRASWNIRLQTDALGAAERAHADLLERLMGAAHTLAVGASIARAVPVGNGLSATGRMTRLGPTLFLLAGDASASSPQGWSARRRVSLLLRLDPPAIGFPAALSVVGASEPPATLADGSDRAPDGWPCAQPKPGAAASRHPSPAPDSLPLADLRRRASIVLPAGATMRGVQPSVRDGACATERADNWGDPARAGPCASWLPIVHAAGDLAVDGGAGQGVLLVDGNLTVGGGFRFAGAVIVGGALGVGAGGSQLTGGVIARSVVDGTGDASGAPVVLRSSCAVGAALVAAGALVPVAERAWGAMR